MARFYTVGHSPRSVEEFLSAMRAYNIDLVAAVCRFPDSKRNPQFNSDALSERFANPGIEYRDFEALDGKQSSPLTDSPNGVRENNSFRGTP